MLIGMDQRPVASNGGCVMAPWRIASANKRRHYCMCTTTMHTRPRARTPYARIGPTRASSSSPSTAVARSRCMDIVTLHSTYRRRGRPFRSVVRARVHLLYVMMNSIPRWGNAGRRIFARAPAYPSPTRPAGDLYLRRDVLRTGAARRATARVDVYVRAMSYAHQTGRTVPERRATSKAV